ncbi:MAG: ribonuclease HI family protein [Methanomassiliicoccales archaeon]
MNVYTDGGSRGNPGPAAYAVIIEGERGEILREFSQYVGRATNNEAEYRGVIAGLREATKFGAKKIRLFVDSELIAKQLLREYAIRASNLIPLAGEAFELMRNFDEVLIAAVRREDPMISRADRLVNMALDARERNSTTKNH